MESLKNMQMLWKKEVYIIKILNLSFEELLIIFRRKLKDENDMKKLEEIKDKI